MYELGILAIWIFFFFFAKIDDNVMTKVLF